MTDNAGVQQYSRTTTSRSAAATRALGRRLGTLLQPGDVVALEGDLGAGKTELVRGACAGAKVPASEVSSPSFAIVATYRGRVPVHHADLYRIGDEDELYGTGFGDLVGGEGALLVEWADRIPGALPAERLTIRLAHHPRQPSSRQIEVVGVGARAAELGAALLAVTRRRAGPVRRAGARPARPAGRRAGAASKARAARKVAATRKSIAGRKAGKAGAGRKASAARKPRAPRKAGAKRSHRSRR